MWVGYIALLIISVIGGLNAVVVKLGASHTSTVTITAFRFFLAAVIITPFYLHQHRRLSKREIRNLSIKSLIFAANMIFFSIAIGYTTAIMSQLLYTAVPVIVLVFAHYFADEKFQKHKLYGLILAFSGIVFLIWQSLINNSLVSTGAPIGNILMLFAITCWSMYIVLSRKLSTKHTAITMGFFNICITAICFLFILPFEWLWHPFSLQNFSLVSVVSVLFLAIFSTVIFLQLLQFGIAKTNAFSASLTSYISPIFASVAASILLGEKVTFALFIGGILIITGAFIATAIDYLKKLSKTVLQ